jgi:hypothetical protein
MDCEAVGDGELDLCLQPAERKPWLKRRAAGAAFVSIVRTDACTFTALFGAPEFLGHENSHHACVPVSCSRLGLPRRGARSDRSVVKHCSRDGIDKLTASLAREVIRHAGDG